MKLSEQLDKAAVDLFRSVESETTAAVSRFVDMGDGTVLRIHLKRFKKPDDAGEPIPATQEDRENAMRLAKHHGW